MSTCALSGLALAHAPPLGSALLSKADGQFSLLVSNRGLLFRTEPEQGWELLCNDALGINTAEVPNVVLLPDGGILVGTTAGLRRTDDRGCSWLDVDSPTALSAPALVADPTNAGTLYAFVYAPGAGGLRKSVDNGSSFRVLYRTADEDYIDSLLVASADPNWIYATGTQFAAGVAPSHFMLRSTDAGLNWLRIPLPLEAKEYRATLLASDPALPEDVLIGTITATPKVDPARILHSRDGGQSFSSIFQGLEIASARYTEDGARLLVGDEQGLHVSDTSSFAFRSTSAASNLGCAFETDGQVFVCGHYEGPASAHSGIGISVDGGASFTGWLDFADVVAPVSCPSDSATFSLCERPWQDWTLEMSTLRAPANSATLAPAASERSSPSAAAPAALSVPSGSTSPLEGASSSSSAPGAETGASASGCNLSETDRGSGWSLLLSLLVLGRRRARTLRPTARCSNESFARDLSRRRAHR